jgi:DNA polymerase-3 subunit alpha
VDFFGGIVKIKNIKKVRGIQAREDSIPDIDCDFESAGRDWVKAYIEKVYGKENVCSLATYGRLQLRAAIKDIGRISGGASFEYLNSVTGKIYGQEWSDLVEGIAKYDEVKNFVSEFPDVMKIVGRCMGQVRHSSIHPAGVIVSPATRINSKGKEVKATLDDFIPIKYQKAKDSNGKEIKVRLTEWEGKFVERAGLLKLDILGIKQLDIFKQILFLIKQRHDIDIDFAEINLEDDKVFKRFRVGDTEGVFQFKSKTQKEYQKLLQPTEFEHLIAANSLIRPGAMLMNAHRDYVAIKNGDKEPEFDKGLEKATKNTYGLYIYQEQIMQAMHLGGLSLAEADVVRTVIKHFDKEKMMTFKEKFVAGMIKIHKYKKKDAEYVWKKMEAFSGYGFNRCISGDSIIYRFTGNQFLKKELTVEDFYYLIHNGEGEDFINKKFKRQRHCGYIRIYDEETNTVRFGKVKNVYKNGIKRVYNITLANGMFIKATLNHRFLRSDKKYVVLDELQIGDKLVVNGKKIKTKIKLGEGRGWTSNYVGRVSNLGKPYKDLRTRKFRAAKLIAKKRSNGFCENCGNGILSSLKHNAEYHHKNGKHNDNRPSNVIYVCNSCHKKLDYEIGKRDGERFTGFYAKISKIISIEYVGKEMTYDIEMLNEPHNFIANGFVSHNSHSCSYAMLGYWCNWLKVYYPEEFWCVNIDYTDDEERTGIVNRILSAYENIEIVYPNINVSDVRFKLLKSGAIVWGLSHIKGVGAKAALEIVKAREGKGFKDIEDFMKRIAKNIVNKRVVQALILAGAFDTMYGVTKDDVERRQEIIEDYFKIRKEKEKPEKQDKDFFEEIFKNLLQINIFDWEKMVAKKNFSDYVNHQDFSGLVSDGSTVTIAGMVVKYRDYLPKTKTEESEKMGFITLRQGDEEIDVVLWSDFWSEHKQKLKLDSKVALRGQKKFDNFRQKDVLYTCKVSKMWALHS